jgi:hypothetical protein
LFLLQASGYRLCAVDAARDLRAFIRRTADCGDGDMPQLSQHHPRRLGQLSDDEIRELFRVFASDGCPRCVFLEQYGKALHAAAPKDFLVLRPASLVLIGKYNLGAAEHFHERAGEERRSA